MDKIICEVCGTSYPEHSSQCPICGFAKPESPKADTNGETGGKYRHVKGGRFSSTNVKKRNNEKKTSVSVSDGFDEDEQPVRKGSNLAAGIIAIVLLLALIAVLGWFIFSIINERFSQIETTPIETTQPVRTLEFHSTEIILSIPGEEKSLDAKIVPSVSNPVFHYVSSDPQVAAVDETGKVTAVSEGQTVIVVSCGVLRGEVTIVCDFSGYEPTVDNSLALKLNRVDITLYEQGQTWDLCADEMTAPRDRVVWTSDDESIVRINNGVIEAVGEGVAKVHATYGSQQASCIVRCKLNESVPTETTEKEESKVTISHTDVTIKVDESFSLFLYDADKKPISVVWKASAEGSVSINGNTITGVKSGEIVTISTEYESETYSCVVRIK